MHDTIEGQIDTACRLRRDGKLLDAIRALEVCLQEAGDCESIWRELALAQYDVWQVCVSKAHTAAVLSLEWVHWPDATTTASHIGGSALQEAYNSFIVAMEYPANKQNPHLLTKLVRLYLEYQAYSGALSVCTLLVEAYAKSDVFVEAVFLSGVSAMALQKHRESAQYFQYVSERPPFRLATYQLHLLAAIELEATGGMKDQMRESYSQAYKAMIALSPVTASEKAAHLVYKTSHKNESQRLQLWFHDSRTWYDLALKFTDLSFPLLALNVFEVVQRRSGAESMPKNAKLAQGVCQYRVGFFSEAVVTIATILQKEFWCPHARLLLRKFSGEWRSRFDLEEQEAATIQLWVRRSWRRRRWRRTAEDLLAEKRHRAATIIECAWRQHSARTRATELRRLRRLQEDAECASMACEDWQEILKQRNGAAVTIQSLHKIFKAKQEVRVRRGLRTKHAQIISTFAGRRSTSSVKRMIIAWQRFLKLQSEERWEAAAAIHRMVRTRLARLGIQRLLAARARLERILADCLGQRAYVISSQTMQLWQAYMRSQRERKRIAASRIQSAWRCFEGRVEYRRQLHRHLVAVDLMHRLLADKTARKLREVWSALSANAVWWRLKKRHAAVVIQRHARGVLDRQLVRKLRSRRRRVEVAVQAMRRRTAQQTLQRVFNGLLRLVELQWEARHSGATHVQRLFRGYAARKRVRFLVECNRILDDPSVSLRGKPETYVLRVCFLLLARLPEQNRVARSQATRQLQRWYRHARRRRRLTKALAKLHKQRAILNRLTMSFHTIARLVFAELKLRVRSKKWRHDRMARRIQRAAMQWLTYRRYRRVLTKRQDRRAVAAAFAHEKRIEYAGKCLRAWHHTVFCGKEAQRAAAVCIQRGYRARVAKRKARLALSKLAARQRLLESLERKPVQQRFRQWEARMIEKAVLTVRASTRSAPLMGMSPDKWKSAAARRDDHLMPQPLTLEQRAELPSVLFYTLLNRVRQSGILQLTPMTGLSCLPTAQLLQLLALAASVIVDGGDSTAVERVVEAMAADRAFPIQKLIFYNAKLSAAHATTLHNLLKHPCAAVTSVVLSNVRLNTAAVVALATSLCHGHSKLEQLVLEGCGIGSAGGAAIAEALSHNMQLWKLDLSQNHIGDSACPAMANALVTNTSLRVLVLSGNTITDRGVMGFLAPALERVMDTPASRLESVVLRQNARISLVARYALEQTTNHRGACVVHLDQPEL